MSSQVERVNWKRPVAEDVLARASACRLDSCAALASRYWKLTPLFSLAFCRPLSVERSTVCPATMTGLLIGWTMPELYGPAVTEVLPSLAEADSVNVDSPNDFMALAFREAEAAGVRGEVPVGA